MSIYLKKYTEAGAHKKRSGEQSILSFFAALDLAEWESLLSDLALHRIEAYEVFCPPSPEMLIATARVLLSRTSERSKALAGTALSRLISKLMTSHSNEKESSDLIFISTALSGCSNVLKDLVLDITVTRNVRLEAARAIANIKEEPKSFWLRLNYRDFPELAPLAIALLGTGSPLKALDILASLQSQPCPDAALEYPLKNAVRGLLSSSGGKLLLLDLYQRLPGWSLPIFLKVLEMPDIGEIIALQEQNSVASALTRILMNPSNPTGSFQELTGSISRDDMAKGVEVLLEQWSPLPESGGPSLKDILNLFERFPSRPSFAALVAICSFYILKIRSGVDRNEEKGLEALVLESLVNQAHVALIERERTSGRGRTLWNSYNSLLVDALANPTTVRLAFRVLSREEKKPSMVSRHVVTIWEAGSLSVEDCIDILYEIRGERFAEAVIKNLGKAVRRKPTPGIVLNIGTQLYDHSPRMLDDSGFNLTPREYLEIQSFSKNVLVFFDEDPKRLISIPGVNTQQGASH